MWVNSLRRRWTVDLPEVFATQAGRPLNARVCGEPDPQTRGMVCTREPAHPGRHLAIGGQLVVAAWPGDHVPTLADLEATP